MNHPCSPEAKLDRIERRREHIRTVSIYGEVWDIFIADYFYCKVWDMFFIIGDYFYCKVLDMFFYIIIGDYCYCKVWDMVEERALQLAPPPGQSLTSILCSLSFEMFCFVFTHFLPLFMPGRTHQSKKHCKPNPTSSLAPPNHQSTIQPPRPLKILVDPFAPPHPPPSPAPAIYFTFFFLFRVFMTLAKLQARMLLTLSCNSSRTWLPSTRWLSYNILRQLQKKKLGLHPFRFSKSKCYITGEPSH